MKKFSEKEQQFIKDMYISHGSKFIAKELNRSVAVIIGYANRIGMRRRICYIIDQSKCSDNEFICLKCKKLTKKWRKRPWRICKKCDSLHRIKYAKDNHEKTRAYAYKHRTTQKYQETKNLLHNRINILLRNCRKHAKKLGLEFNLKPIDIVLPEYCPVTGIKLAFTNGKNGQYNSYSLDRIDNTKGYTKDNVKIISFRANYVKSYATKEEIYKVYLFLKSKNL